MDESCIVGKLVRTVKAFFGSRKDRSPFTEKNAFCGNGSTFPSLWVLENARIIL